jgi:nitric oxide reductase NorQ protein
MQGIFNPDQEINMTIRRNSMEKTRKRTSFPKNDTVTPEASNGFVETPYVRNITERALSYLQVGYPVHFSGPAGSGKTTLAFHVAAQLKRNVMLIHGDDEFGSSDLIGKDSGYRKAKVVDNYIHSVVKMEESMNTVWADNRLTIACQQGCTLVYDEFTRSRPEANNAFLSVLEEKILNLPSLRSLGQGYLQVHPSFRAIFTSNPQEYAGVHKTQDAIMDRLITITLDHFDRNTEIEVTMSKSQLSRKDVQVIVNIVRKVRNMGVNNHRPTIRACIAIGKILNHMGGGASKDNPVFRQICRDVLNVDTTKVTRDGAPLLPEKIDEFIDRI